MACCNHQQTHDALVADVDTLFAKNHEWAEKMLALDADFFTRLKQVHAPEFLWIGCSDARVPANELIGLKAGEVFVHRNIANQVLAADMNCQSVVEYAVEVLKVRHIIVMGHYDCGGVKAAIKGGAPDLVDHWVRPIRKLFFRQREEMHGLDDKQQVNRLVEMNAIEQVKNLTHLPSVRRAWDSGQPLMIHGWVYGLSDGLIKDLGTSVDSVETAQALFNEG
ncbi:MAG: carbonic anhydrase [Thiotrichales bacterium]|jgi:carbonic anhydrase|nr:carbonic anhydrase [Thiotrichales bacterium]